MYLSAVDDKSMAHWKRMRMKWEILPFSRVLCLSMSTVLSSKQKKKICLIGNMLTRYKTARVYKHAGNCKPRRSRRETPGVAKCFFDFSSALQLPECLYHSI